MRTWAQARFATDVLGFQVVERTGTSAVAAGRIRGIRLGIAIGAEPRPVGSSRLVSETGVVDVGRAFRRPAREQALRPRMGQRLARRLPTARGYTTYRAIPG